MSYLQSAAKAAPRPPILTIVGFPGVGKTTLAASFPEPIFVQAESATTVFESLPEADQPTFFPELPAPSKERGTKPSEALLDQLRELATEDHQYKTVVLDAVTTLHALLEQEIVTHDPASPTSIGEAAGGYGKGYLAVAGIHARVRQAVEHLRSKRGMGVVFLAHSGIAKVKDRPDVEAYSTWSLDMHEASRRVYVATSDAVMYLQAREFVHGHEEDKRGRTTKLGRVTRTGQRVLITSSDGTTGFVDAKTRYEMPREIEVEKGENPILQYIPFYKEENGNV